MSTHHTDNDERAAVIALFTDGFARSGLPYRQAERAARWLYDRARRQYDRAGAPYGPTHAGMLKWFTRKRLTPSA